MTTVAHAYPWDIVGDPAAAARIAGLGVDAVALAAAYHTVRAATPRHPVHRIVDARHAALYLPVREEAWHGKRLVPAEPSWMDGPDSFGTASRSLRDAGLPVYAWTVLTHSSRLGDAHPELTVHNAFGDRYPYALCPVNEDVVEYCQTLVDEIVCAGNPDGVVLEACGPLGLVHGGHHEKTEGADWGEVHRRLLSLCFCAGCRIAYHDAGIDATDLGHRIRAAVDGEAAPDDMGEALGAELAAAVLGVRASIARELRRRLVGRVRDLVPDARVVLHASADPWATGPFATVAPDVGAQVDVFTAMGWSGPGPAEAGIRALRDVAGPDARVAAYLLALPPTPADGAAVAEEARRFAQSGVAELHIYHAGLASNRRLAAIRAALVG